jgi:hypothetical protein
LPVSLRHFKLIEFSAIVTRDLIYPGDRPCLISGSEEASTTMKLRVLDQLLCIAASAYGVMCVGAQPSDAPADYASGGVMLSGHRLRRELPNGIALAACRTIVKPGETCEDVASRTGECIEEF